MNLLNKQLTKELLKNKLFICLIFLLTCFTSFMYFFIHFSIDGNLRHLKSLSSLTENQKLYLNALNSNTSLAASFLWGSILLTGFVFFIFFYVFFKKNSKALGTFKALGFKDSTISYSFVSFSFMLSILGGALGLPLGYFAGDILIQANIASYQVTHLVKQISASTFLIGLLLPAILFSLTTYFTYALIKKQDIAFLIAPRNDAATYSGLLAIAHKLAQFYPGRNKQGIKLALRKPITLFLILIAVMTFSIMFILAYALNLSSQGINDAKAPDASNLNPTAIVQSTQTPLDEEALSAQERNSVSNHTSAVINQVIGCIAGCILLFIALLLNFQDSTRDVLILNLMGYKPPAIRKMLINLYQPIICFFFVITLYPCILIVKGILKSLSLQIGDYIPFQTNLFVLIGIFILLNVIYLCVQFTFSLGIKRVIASDKVYEYTYSE